MKQHLTALILSLATAILPAASAYAAELGVITHNYGRNSFNGYIPQGSNTVRGSHVLIEERARVPFFDSFDFSSIRYDRIDSLDLTLTFDRAGPRTFTRGPLAGVTRETWDLNIPGSRVGATFDNFTARLDDDQVPMTFVLDPSSDTGGRDAFTTAVANQRVDFWFTEPGFFGNDGFRLFAASLTVNGLAPVPLPAPGLLLIAALGGLGVMRRRKAKATA